MSEYMTTALTAIKAKVKLLADPGVVPLNQAIELEERPPAESLTQLVYAIFGLVTLALLWALLTRVDVVTNAPGRLMPVGDLVAVQHLEGGVIADILVAEGERVRKGQPLLRLAALDTEGRLEQLKAKRATHLIAIEGERAVTEGRTPAFDKVVDGFVRQKAEQLSLYNARKQAIEAERTVLAAQKAQRESEVSRLTSQLIVLRQDERIAQEELALRSDLFQRKLTTRDRFYGAQRDATDRQKQRLNARDQLVSAESQLAEYDQKLREFEARTHAEAQESIAKHTADLAEVDAALRNEEGRAKRLNLNAPVAGIVSGLAVKAVNAVVKPGETLMEIVPTDVPLVAIAEVAPQDIAQVSIGQRADIRVSAFDYATFGTLEGKVDRISATTFADQNGRQFYKVRVQLARNHFGNDPTKARILPGMEVEVDVKTGARSVLAYMLKPVTRTWDSALKEP
ncbi:MAG: HlyD family type I secretion periplasmic adaptor subunit [Alphaproteobacteria bacterium]|nr:HlyD family type I secretion periplasmic adaptor subunit [Alphaproteobacteria bacterium]